MATITRRDWQSISTEVVARAGGINYSGFAARAEQAIHAAYLDIACLYAHYPLMQYETFSQPTTQNYHTIPTEAWAILGVAESNATSDAPATPLKRLDFSGYLGSGTLSYTTTERPEAYFVRASYTDPTQYRHLVFAVAQLDQARNYYLFYQRLPTAPDFDSTTTYPEIDKVWDEHLIELSLVKIGNLIGDQQLASINAALYKDFVSQIGVELLRDVPTAATSDAKTTNTQPSGKNP